MLLRTCALTLFLLSGCAGRQTILLKSAVEVDMGYDGAYSSSTGVLTRETCADSEAEVKAVLPQRTLDEIGEIADRSGFFDLPSTLSLSRYDDGSVSVIAPCPDYAIDIAYRGKRHRVSWSCDVVQQCRQPKEVRALYSAITTALDRFIRRLPASKCLRY